MIIVLLLVVVGNLMDYATTMYAISKGAREGNPLVGLNISRVKYIGAAVMGMACAVAYQNDPFYGYVASGLIFVFYVVVSLHNLRVARYMQTRS